MVEKHVYLLMTSTFGRNHSRRTGYCEKSPGACPGPVLSVLRKVALFSKVEKTEKVCARALIQ